MIAPNKARPIGRAFFAYSGIDFAALRRDARCCLPREWSHFEAICAAGEPEGARPASDEMFASPQGNAFSLPREWLHFKAICAAGEPEGARPASDEMFASPQGNAFSLPREWLHFKAICAAGEPEGARPASDEIFASPQGDAPVTPPAPPRCGSRRGSICRSAAAADTERSARPRRWT